MLPHDREMARGVHRSAATRNWCAMTGHASSIPVPRAPALLRPICILATFANEVALCDTSERILYTCTCASSLILRGQPTGCKVSHSPLSYVWYIHADAADDRHAHTVRERERERERERDTCARVLVGMHDVQRIFTITAALAVCPAPGPSVTLTALLI